MRKGRSPNHQDPANILGRWMFILIVFFLAFAMMYKNVWFVNFRTRVASAMGERSDHNLIPLPKNRKTKTSQRLVLRKD